MSAITKHNEEINEKRIENMRYKQSNERDVICVYVEPKINPGEFTFFTNRSNRHTYSYTY